MKTGLIYTTRFILREITESDTDIIVKWRSAPEVYRYFRSSHRLTEEEHLRWYRERYLADKRQIFWMALKAEENAPTGVFGLRRSEDKGTEAEISYILAPEAQGKGYAGEAVTALLEWAAKEWRCLSVFAEIHYKNAASIGFIKRMGFERTEQNGTFIIFTRNI